MGQEFPDSRLLMSKAPWVKLFKGTRSAPTFAYKSTNGSDSDDLTDTGKSWKPGQACDSLFQDPLVPEWSAHSTDPCGKAQERHLDGYFLDLFGNFSMIAFAHHSILILHRNL